MMCSGSLRKVGPDYMPMEGEHQAQEGHVSDFSILLQLSANDDLIGFRRAVEEKGLDFNKSGLWYGRRIGSKKMGFEERTPLMIASTFGSKRVLNYILEKGCVDINRGYGSDGATALHCAVAGGSTASLDVIKLLLDSSADLDSLDANRNRAADLIYLCRVRSQKKMLAQLLKGFSGDSDEGYWSIEEPQVTEMKNGSEKKEYPFDPSLPDIKSGICGTDEFRMYTFKVKPCSRAYSHDWTECPFVHPGENARRRDPRKYRYSCVPCPDFRKGGCLLGDSCEYSHGIFECWLHPAQYRTRMCKDELSCNRRVCFFAHKPEELRPFYAVPSPRSYALGASSLTPPGTPPSASSPIQFLGSRLRTGLNTRNINLDAVTLLSSFEMDPSNAAVSPVMESRSSAFPKRSLSFVDHRHGGGTSPSYSSPISSATAMPSTLCGWGSPDGKLDWGVKNEELGKFRKSASFGVQNRFANGGASLSTVADESDVLWVHSLVSSGNFRMEDQQHSCVNNRGSEMHPTWADQERIVA